MKRTMKKVASIILAATMVITGIKYSPKVVNAADTPSAYSTIEAENHVSSNGVSKDTNSNVSGGYNIGGLTNGKWTSYDLQFDVPATGLRICYTSIAGISSGSVEVYVDSMDNQKVGTVALPNTSATGWENGYETLSADLDAEISAGTHTIYLKFVTSGGKNWVANVDYFSFTDGEEIAPVEDGYVYNFTESGDGFVVGFADENEYEAGDVSYTVNIGNYSTSVAEPGDAIDLSNAGLVEGQKYEVNIVTKYVNGTVTKYSAPSDTTTFTYNTSKKADDYKNGIAQIFITTSRSSKTSSVDLYTDTSKKKVNAAIVVKTEDGADIEAANYGTVNVRGNSTSLAQKKAYNFKFDSKENLFGMGKAKKWSLLANLFDKALIRTQIGMNFHTSLEEGHASGNQFSSQCKPVDLYMDGKYLGTYLLIESVETGGTRVDIDIEYIDGNDDIEDGKVEEHVVNGVTYKLNDVLLELANDIKEVESRYDTEAYYFATSYLDEWFAINEPERNEESSYGYRVNDNNKPAFVTNAQKFLNDFEKVLTSKTYASDDAQYEDIVKYIDVESFVDFYITSELFMTKDLNFSSTRFYIEDGKLYAGPLWDLDLSSGNSIDHKGYEDFYAQDFLWFKNLMENDVFKNMVITRYTALQGKIQNIYGEGGAIEQAYEEIKKSAKTNYENAYNVFSSSNNGYYNGWGYNTIYGIEHRVWTGNEAANLASWNGVYGNNTVHSDYVSYVNDFKEWMKNRNEWLMAQWDISVKQPIEAFGEVIGSPSNNTISVVWGQNQEQIDLGQKYNVYIDGVIALENQDCGYYEITGIAPGAHTVKITAVLSGFETTGVTQTVTVLGEAVTEPPTEEESSKDDSENIIRIDGGIEINGYQISAGVKGVRTIYSVDKDIDGKDVVASGVIYSLADYANESELYVGSTNKYVKNYESTSIGVNEVKYSNSDIATSYTMTMKFATTQAAEYTAKWRVCAYAKLSDGTYVYSKAREYTIYDIADYLHQGCKMNTQAAHDYLYTGILSIVNPDYKAKDFNWSNVIVGA